MRELGVKIAWKPLVYSIRHRVTTLNHNVQSADYEAPTRGSAAGAAAVTIFGGPSIYGARMCRSYALPRTGDTTSHTATERHRI